MEKRTVHLRTRDGLFVFIVISDVLEPIKSAQAHKDIEAAAQTAQVNVLAHATDNVQLNVRSEEVTGASTLPSLSTTLTSPTYNSAPHPSLTSVLKFQFGIF